MKGPADSDVVLNVLKGCRCSYEFLSFLFQTLSLKISFNLAIKHTYKHHCPYSPFLFLLLSSSSFHWEQSRASALSFSAEVKKTSLLPHERDLVTSEPTLITQKQIFFLLFSCHPFTQLYPDCLFSISLYIKMSFPALIAGRGTWQAHLSFQSQQGWYLSASFHLFKIYRVPLMTVYLEYDWLAPFWV